MNYNDDMIQASELMDDLIVLREDPTDENSQDRAMLEYALVEAGVLDVADKDVTGQDGSVLILESYFSEYIRDMAMDTETAAGVELLNAWPFNCVDWDEAAAAVKSDYTEVVLPGGREYLIECR